GTSSSLLQRYRIFSTVASGSPTRFLNRVAIWLRALRTSCKRDPSRSHYIFYAQLDSRFADRDNLHSMVSPIVIALPDGVSRPTHKPCTISSTVSSSGVSRNASCEPSQKVSFIAT